jgi:hypothetical protein
MQSMFIDLAEQVHHIHAEVDFGPPFDGHTYIWHWKSIIIRFVVIPFTFILFLISLVNSRYISPACAEYVLLVVH